MDAPTPETLPEPPRRRPGPEDFPHRTPRALKAWCARLPTSDPESSADRLRDALNELNRLALEPGARADLLRVLEAAALPLIPRMEQSLRQRPLPLGERSRQRAAAFADLLQALLTAELLVARELIDAGSRQQRRALAPLQHATALLAAIAVHHWRLYQALPGGHWPRLHGVLRNARALGIADRRAASRARFGPLALDSVERMTARLMTLGSADANALEIGEIDLLARWINDIPLVCGSAPDAAGHPAQPVLCAPPERDRAPALTPRDASPDELACCIELAPALEALRSDPEALEPARREGRSLPERLLVQWSRMPVRRYSRETARDQERLCLAGLERIHHYLTNELQPAPQRPRPDTATALARDQERVAVFELSAAAVEGSELALADENTPASPAPERRSLAGTPDVAASAWEQIARGASVAPAPEAARAPAEDTPPPEPWQVDDIGAGGARLRLDQPRQTLLTGDLLALRPPNGHTWQVAALRWIRDDPQGGICIGVEYLAGHCLPVRVQGFQAGRAVGTTYPGLFVPARIDRQGSAVFLPARAFDRASRIVCWLGDRGRVLLLDGERSGTTLFTEAGCRITDTELTNDDTAARHGSPPSGELSLSLRDPETGTP